MTQSPPRFDLGILEDLVEGSDQEWQQWLNQVVASLSPESLVELEELAYRFVDRRYPDDPASLVNSRYRQGKRRKAEIRAIFDEAHQLLLAHQLEQTEGLRTLTLDYHRGKVQDLLYADRRPALRQRRRDQLEDAIQVGLATDQELQRQLALDDQAHQRRKEFASLEHDLAIDKQHVTAEIERARRKLDQPHELHDRLLSVLTGLTQYQMSLNDRAMRNPALADRLRMMALGLTTVMSSVQSLMTELNRLGDNPPIPNNCGSRVNRS